MRSSSLRRWLAACALPVFAIFSGCGSILGTGGASKVPATETTSVTISGSVYGGQQAIAGASIQVYATGTAGDSSAAIALLSTPAKTDETGAFTVSNLQSCASSASEVYLVATGGAPAESGGGTNPNASLMTLLGSCSTLASTSSIRINEVTTIASVYAVASYMSSAASVGFSAEGAQSFTNSLVLASELANLPAGTSPGVVPAGEAAPVEKLDTLANIVSSCVDSAGGSAGDGSACGNLFQYSGTGPTAAKDTVGAVLAIAKAPADNVNSIYALAGASSAYQPLLTSAPADWTLAMIQTPPAPMFSPAGGSYTSTQTVTLEDGDGVAALYYTTDGTTPTVSSSRYSVGISVSSSTTVRAVAIDEGLMSGVGSAAYTIGGPPAPGFSPEPGTYSSSQSVTLADGDSSAMIYYTVDGSTPSASSARYSGPIKISATTTLRAVAVDGSLNSSVATGTYTLTPPPAPVFSPAPGTYSSAESITLSDADPSAVLYYTMDGSTPSASSARYSGAINLSASSTVRAIAVDGGLSSRVATSIYTLTPPAAPSFSPAPGSYVGAQTLTITAATPSAMIRYTADGSTPSSSSTLYPGPFRLSSSATIRAIAILGSLTSAVASGSYTIAAPSVVVVIVAPANATVTAGSTQQFAASVIGTRSTGVTWLVSGAACNEAACGTITPGGLYTAPATVPSQINVIITVTSVADPLQSASAIVTLLPANGKAYYIAPADAGGNDANDGLTPGSPWLTIAKVNASNIFPGDSILFHDGGVWREELTLHSSGTALNPITIASYGTGAQPIITGTNLLSTWVADPIPNVWDSVMPTAPNQLFLSGTRAAQGTSKASLKQHEWYWSNGVLSFYESAGDPTGVGYVIAASQRDYAINTNGNSYLTISTLTLTGANQVDLYFGGDTHNITVTHIDVSLSYGDGIRNKSSATFDSSVISSNSIHDNGASGIQLVTSGVATNVISNNVIAYNSQIYSSTAPDHAYSGGIYLWTVGGNNIVTQNTSYRNGYLEDNTPVGTVGVGLWFDTVAAGNTLSYNLVHDNNNGGIRLEDSAHCSVVDNVTYLNDNPANYTAGIAVLSYNGIAPTDSDVIYGNSGYGNYYGLYMSGAMEGIQRFITNNLVENNVFTGSFSGYNLWAAYGAENDGYMGYGNIYTYNAFGVETAAFIRWGVARSEPTYSGWETAGGNCGMIGCSHSMESDPLFTDPAAGNLTLIQNSPAVGAGADLGPPYNVGLLPDSMWPNVVNIRSQSARWNIGAYLTP
jgi:parallel beta-helix repeat protein